MPLQEGDRCEVGRLLDYSQVREGLNGGDDAEEGRHLGCLGDVAYEEHLERLRENFVGLGSPIITSSTSGSGQHRTKAIIVEVEKTVVDGVDSSKSSQVIQLHWQCHLAGELHIPDCTQ